MEKVKSTLGQILIDMGYITEKQLEEALEEQKRTGERIGQIFIDRGYITPDILTKALEIQLGLSSIKIEENSVDFATVNLLKEEYIRTNKILPFKIDGNLLFVACVPPINPKIIEDIRLKTGYRIRTFIITDDEFIKTVNNIFSIKDKTKNVSKSLENQEEFVRVIMDGAGDATTVSLTNSIISDAIHRNASDIHIDPETNYTKIKYRIDGVMKDVITLPKDTADSVISLIKVNAKMDIAERRKAQDGHFTAKHEEDMYDFRVSSVGTYFGEKVDIRILSKKTVLLPLERLGMLPQQLETFNRIIQKPYGIILITGPTGAGKTTTMYSTLLSLNNGEREIVTIEDPVEYSVPSAVQIQINEEAGIDFATGLRTILRLDPNVIMVGEIRDVETAKIAVDSALTGHLVLASIHTNDAVSTPIRLLNLGVEPYLVSSSLVGVVAQRLVRDICINCKKEHVLLEEEKPIKERIEKELGVDDVHFKEGSGCAFCDYTGYKGRSGVFEVLEIDRKMRKLIEETKSYDEMYDTAIENGMIPMKKAVFMKLYQGVTTIEEARRIVEF